MVGAVRQIITSGRLTKTSEVNALRAVLKSAGPMSKENRHSRNQQIATLQAVLTGYDMSQVPGLFLITATLLSSMAPLIDEALTATGTPDHERAALVGFKERMIRKGIWPNDPGPTA